MVQFKRFFYLLISFFLGKFFNDAFSITNSLNIGNFNGTYTIPFIYIFPIYYFPIIIFFTIFTYLYIHKNILFDFKKDKFKLKKIISIILSEEALLNILNIEFIGFSFLLGTKYGKLLNNFYESFHFPPFLGFSFFCFFSFLTASLLIETIFYSKNSSNQFENFELLESRKPQIPLLETYLKYANKIGIVGEWGAGKSSFINFFINNNESVESIYIDVSLYSDISKIINTITFKLNEILIKHNLPSSNFFSIKSLFKEYNFLFKILLTLHYNQSIEKEHESLKLKLSKLNTKKIILVLDNLERIHEDDASKILTLFSFVDEFFKDTGVKIIILFEENYLTKVLKINETYLEKYIEEKISLKPAPLKDLLFLFNNKYFSLEINNFLKKLEKFKTHIVKFKLDNNFYTLVKNEDISIIKDELTEFCDTLIKTLHNPRYLKRLYNRTIDNIHDYSLETVIEYEIFTDFNKFNINSIEHKPYHFNTISDVYSKFYYEFYFDLSSYSHQEVVLKKITFKLLSQSKNISLKDFINSSIKKYLESIEFWRSDDFISFIEFLDAHLEPKDSVDCLLKIKSQLPDKIFIFYNYSSFYSLLSKSFTEDLFSDSLFKGKFKISISAFENFDYDKSKINLFMAYLGNTNWFKVLLQNFIPINILTHDFYANQFNSFLELCNYSSSKDNYNEKINFFITTLKKMSETFRTNSYEKSNDYYFYFSRMIQTIESINSIEFIDINSNLSSSSNITITIENIKNLQYSPTFSLTYVSSNSLFIDSISINTLEDIKKIRADLTFIKNELLSDHDKLRNNENLIAKIASLFFEISSFEKTLQ